MIQLNVNPVDAGTQQPVQTFIATIGIMDSVGNAVPMEPAIRVQSNFWNGGKYPNGRAPYTVYGSVRASGYKESYITPTTWDGVSTLNIPVVMQQGFKRPVAVDHAPLPAFDQSDSGGIVHTVPPPELVIPPHFSDPLFLRADFSGLTLDLHRWSPTIEADLQALQIPGANSTPYRMLMSPMLYLYPRKWQDAWLTESAERGYDDVVIASTGWNLPTITPQQLLQWAQYIRSWGNRIVYWGPLLANDPYLLTLLEAGAVNFHVLGEEVDGKVTAQQYQTLLDAALPNGIPIGAHFTDNFPDGFPKDTFFDGRSMKSFADYNGKVHLCYQANQNDSAGTQGARLYYARQRVNLGLVGGDGRPAPDSRVILFEIMATNELFGRCSEEYGCLRSLEALYCPQGQPGIRPLSGGCDGLRYPDGAPV